MTTEEPDGGLRVGDAERAEAQERLATHAADGRLTVEEYQERSAQATQARTRSELAAVFRDLPGSASSVERRPSTGTSRVEHSLAITGPSALLAFFICGFLFHGWAWAWIFFLLPPLGITLNRKERPRT